MPSSIKSIVAMLALWLAWTSRANAGMPSVTLADVDRAVRTIRRSGLNDAAGQRLEVLSFFLIGLLVCAWVIRGLWNGLRKDFPILPRLSYARALGMMVLWGLLFVLVLTMISGARELMTPGAWEKQGLTYRLAPPARPPAVEAEITVRVQAIRRLGDQLLAVARRHEGAFPAAGQVGEIDDALWNLPSPPGGRYVYLGGRMLDRNTSDDWPSPLLHEPESVGADRLVLMTDGSVQWMPASEIERRARSGAL